ncbi:hypothetical protein [Microbacterium resistens]|uniref:hypothetical protein n=1 Tax=Microbacterium resistens TaxID=156977 RepID=UPI0037CB3DDD
MIVPSGAVFAYTAIEMVGIAAGEGEDPKREVTKAVNAPQSRHGEAGSGFTLKLSGSGVPLGGHRDVRRSRSASLGESPSTRTSRPPATDRIGFARTAGATMKESPADGGTLSHMSVTIILR